MKDIINVFSYIVSSDYGFAPNPFWDYCTLACCKPVIRRTASVGDWIVGLSPKALGNDIVFAMKVTEKTPVADYWKNKRFRNKKAKMQSADPIRHRGDNIYKPIKNVGFQQQPSEHSNRDGTENEKQKERDINGEFVLISDDFTYFGTKAKKLPKKFLDIIVSRGHKRFECDPKDVLKGKGGMVGSLIRYFEKLPKGKKGNPSTWPESGNRNKPFSCKC